MSERPLTSTVRLVLPEFLRNRIFIIIFFLHFIYFLFSKFLGQAWSSKSPTRHCSSKIRYYRVHLKNFIIYESKFWSKIQLLFKKSQKQNFYQKSKFWGKISSWIKNRNFYQQSKFCSNYNLGQLMKLWLTVNILFKNIYLGSGIKIRSKSVFFSIRIFCSLENLSYHLYFGQNYRKT